MHDLLSCITGEVVQTDILSRPQRVCRILDDLVSCRQLWQRLTQQRDSLASERGCLHRSRQAVPMISSASPQQNGSSGAQLQHSGSSIHLSFYALSCVRMGTVVQAYSAMCGMRLHIESLTPLPCCAPHFRGYRRQSPDSLHVWKQLCRLSCVVAAEEGPRIIQHEVPLSRIPSVHHCNRYSRPWGHS